MRPFTLGIMIVAVMSTITCPVAVAQSASSQAISVAAGQQVRLGYYAVFKNDCSAGPTPTIRMSRSAQHGTVTIATGTLATTRLRSCPETKAPVQVVFYKANVAFTGPDSVAFDVVNPVTGATEPQEIAITVTAATRPN